LRASSMLVSADTSVRQKDYTAARIPPIRYSR
jgi:hypothetical protein